MLYFINIITVEIEGITCYQQKWIYINSINKN